MYAMQTGTACRCRPLVDDPNDEDAPKGVHEDDLDLVYEPQDSILDELYERDLDEESRQRQMATMTTLGQKALDIVTGARNKCYGNPYDNHRASAELWNTYLQRRGLLVEGQKMTAVDHCVMMGSLLKASRQAHWSQEDNFLDTIGYALNAWACHQEEEYRKQHAHEEFAG